jgi:hypothetical protein
MVTFEARRPSHTYASHIMAVASRRCQVDVSEEAMQICGERVATHGSSKRHCVNSIAVDTSYHFTVRLLLS